MIARTVVVSWLGHVVVETEDRQRALTVAAVGGLGLGLVLAVFGMPPVDLHLPWHFWGFMGPTCGMTRGVAAALRGDVALAWAYNPASLLVVSGALLALLRAAIGSARAAWVTFYLDLTRAGWGLFILAVAVLWLNQQSHAEFLMTR